MIGYQCFRTFRRQHRIQRQCTTSGTSKSESSSATQNNQHGMFLPKFKLLFIVSPDSSVSPKFMYCTIFPQMMSLISCMTLRTRNLRFCGARNLSPNNTARIQTPAPCLSSRWAEEHHLHCDLCHVLQISIEDKGVSRIFACGACNDVLVWKRISP